MQLCAGQCWRCCITHSGSRTKNIFPSREWTRCCYKLTQQGVLASIGRGRWSRAVLFEVATNNTHLQLLLVYQLSILFLVREKIYHSHIWEAAVGVFVNWKTTPFITWIIFYMADRLLWIKDVFEGEDLPLLIQKIWKVKLIRKFSQ